MGQKEGFICIFRTPYQSEITIIKSLLETNKIPYFIENENFASLQASDGAINFGVMVKSDSVSIAEELLKEFIHPSDAQGSLKEELAKKQREKRPYPYLFSGIFGIVVGFAFFVLAAFLIKAKLVNLGKAETIFKIIMALILGIAGFFITLGSMKEVILALNILRRRQS